MSTALDSKISLEMYVKSMGKRFTAFLASGMTKEEKLAAIINVMESDVQEKRVLARQIHAQMTALMDPEDKAVQPLEALIAKRAKLVQLAADAENQGDAATVGQARQSIKGLQRLLDSQQKTYDTLKAAYEVAFANYKTAMNALENARTNGPAMLNAIQAHKDALAMGDKARKTNQIDASFMDDLAKELGQAQNELRSDQVIENDLRADKAGSIDAKLAAMDAEVEEDDLMAEIREAAAKKGGKKEAPAAAAATYQVTVTPAEKK